MNKKINVPEDKKGFIIGRQKSGLRFISEATGANVFIRSNEIYVQGTVDQIKQAEKFIQNKLAGISNNNEKNSNERVFKVPSAFVGAIIGKQGKNLQRLKTKTCTRVHLEPIDDQFVQIKIIGDPENCRKARGFIQDIILSCGAHNARQELGGGSEFACFKRDYLDTEFKLVEQCDQPKLNLYIKRKLYEIKILDTPAKTNKKGEGKDAALSVIENGLLPILENLSIQREEKKLLVDLWCHFGKVFFHDVQLEDFDDGEIFTMEKINKRLIGSSQLSQRGTDARKDCWKTTFREGVCVEKISEEKKNSFLSFTGHTQWRYDYAFATPSGRNVRFKSWENISADEPPRQVKNLLTRVTVHGQENALLSWLCYPSNTLVRCDILVPSSEYDCRLKLRTGPRFVNPKSTEDEEEDRILSGYLSHCTLDNHQLNLPFEKALPEGFECLFYRVAQEDLYLYEADEEDEEDENFTILFLDEEGWESDTSEVKKQKQTGIRVVMNSWSDALLSGNSWEPQKIVDLLPIYMEFVETLQKNLFR